MMNPGDLPVLIDTRMGIGMLVYAAVSWAVGLVWLYRLTKLEV
jgi:hypothetical protein